MEAQETTQGNEATTFEQPSFSQLLGASRGKSAPTPEAEASEVTATEPAATAATDEAVTTEATPAASAEAKLEQTVPATASPAETAVATTTEATEPTGTMVPVAVVQALREELRQAKALIPQQPPPVEEYQPQTEVDPQTAQYEQLNHRFINLSLNAAKRIHSDFDAAFEACKEACANNQELANNIRNSEDPGEAAYQTGKNFALAKQYGVGVGDLNGLVAAVEQKLEKTLREKITAEFEGKLTAKAAERAKTPTDITAARSAGGAVESEWTQPSFADQLRSVYKR